MGGGAMTVKQMLQKQDRGTGPVPTQTFYGGNIAGLPTPSVGAVQSRTGASNAGQFGVVNPHTIVLIILVIIGIGYIVHHISFEESIRAK